MTKRYLKFFEVKIKSVVRYELNGSFTTNNVAALPLRTVMQQIKVLFSGGTAILKELPSGVKFYLADINLDEELNKATLLINKSDPNEPDQTISNPVAKDRKSLKKPAGYGNDYSAHVSFNLIEASPNVYMMVYESPKGGVLGTHIHSFLNFLLRECRHANEAAYKVNHPSGAMENGQPVKANALHSVELSGKISDDFYNDILNGELGRIELANYEHCGDPWDQNNSFKQDKRILILKPEIQNLPAESFFDAIRKACSKGADFDYQKATIVFKDPSDNQRSIEINTEDLTLSDDERYVKKAVINTPTLNDNGYGSIENEIKTALYAHL